MPVVLGLNTGHNASAALLKDGEIVYSHSGKLTYDQLSNEIEKHK